jgi:hypothetical protein
MGRRLATDVHVIPEGGGMNLIVLPAGSRVPDWATDQFSDEFAAYLPEDDETDDGASDQAAAGGAPDTDYASWPPERLEAALLERNLPTSGSKAKLVSILTDDDADRAASLAGGSAAS